MSTYKFKVGYPCLACGNKDTHITMPDEIVECRSCGAHWDDGLDEGEEEIWYERP